MGPDEKAAQHSKSLCDETGRSAALIANAPGSGRSSYDANGRVDTITYPTGFAVKRVYNAQGYLSQVQNAADAAEVFWTADVVDAEGHVLQETLGNGLTTTRQYNQLTNRLEAITAGPNANGSIQNLSFSHDVVGNLRSRSDNVLGWTENFSYDELNRITGVAGPANKTYAYDAIGNITNKSDVGAYTYDPLHPHAVASAGGNSYTCDANGNMLSGAGRTLTWASFDRPASISTAGAYVSMAYDAGHKRISKTNSVTGENTVYVGGGFEQVTLNGITKAKHYIRSGNGLVAIMEQVATIKLMKYVHNDQLGSINVITDGTGAVLERLSFDAFGNPRNPDGSDAATPITSTQTTRGYTGHKIDAEVGLINMNARLYDPVLGRFISADVTIDAPQDMQTFNRYTYVINNPFAHTDPTGNWSWKNFFKAAKPVVTIAVAAASYFTAGYAMAAYAGGGATFAGTTASYAALAGSSLGTAMVGGGVAGAVAGASMTALNGGNLSEIATAGLVGGIAGALTAGITRGFGDAGYRQIGRMFGSGINGFIQSGGKAGGFARGFAAGLIPQDLTFGRGGISGEGASGFLAGLGSIGNGITRDGLRGYIVGGRDGILPGIAIGQANNAIGHVVGFVGSSGQLPSFKNGAFEYTGNATGNGITFGNVAFTDGSTGVMEHEYGHMPQGEWLGAAYMPAHAVALSTSVILDGWNTPFGSGHGPSNWLENPPMHQSAGSYAY